jgi:hypothetical protein
MRVFGYCGLVCQSWDSAWDRIAEDIFFMDLLGLAKVCFCFSSSFFLNWKWICLGSTISALVSTITFKFEQWILSINTHIRYRLVNLVLRFTVYLSHLDCTPLFSPSQSFFLFIHFHRQCGRFWLTEGCRCHPDIFLIKDIDCAFPSREDEADSSVGPSYMAPYPGMV